MSPTRFIPVIPDNAPFTLEQRAWLNGFLAGLYSFTPLPGNPPAAPAPALALQDLIPLAILVGSQTGTAEKLAKRVSKAAAERGFAPVIHDLSKVSPAQLTRESTALILTSTYGDGEPPDNAKGFWLALQAPDAPRLEQLRFSVCALGDSNYPKFCQFGKDLDARLSALGAQRVLDRQDCDVEFEQGFAAWLAAALGQLSASSSTAHPSVTTSSVPATESAADAEPRWNRDRPFGSRLTTNLRLTPPASAKDVRHFALRIQNSGLAYEVGDALGVWPTNDPSLVQSLLAALKHNGDESVPDRHGNATSLRLALTRDYEISRIPRNLLSRFAEASQDPELVRVASPSANGALDTFLRGRDVLDLITSHPEVSLSPADFVAALRKLQPRLYSIASSPKTHPDEIHLCVSVVRYESRGRLRSGVASACLADRTGPDAEVPVFLHRNPAFRPPPSDLPLIMIGPGTGIAPFRAFLQDRQAIGAKGSNWLFFGDQHEASDFLYRDEVLTWARDGILNRLELAWSRDHTEKVYVQHRMLEHSEELWKWLEAGASVAVCGDASRMAKDVDTALHQIVQTAGGRSPEAAAEYVRQMTAQRRYCRDVY